MVKIKLFILILKFFQNNIKLFFIEGKNFSETSALLIKFVES